MRTQTQALRDECESLHGGVEMLRAVADTVETVPFGSLLRGVEAVSRFLNQDVLPLAKAEDQVEYPAVGRILGSDAATAPMHHEYLRLCQLTGELRQIHQRLSCPEATAREANTLRGTLYGLYELLRVHLTNEESVYLPLLDTRLSPADMHTMADRMYLVEERIRHG
jgi:iron-sulfur cluster repair protein YtfE (RIC family)